MSHILYLRCVSHDPNIRSDEVGHNLSDLPKLREDLANRKVLVSKMKVLESEDMLWDMHPDEPRKRNLWWFLWMHRNCNLGIWDEYDHNHPVIEQEQEDAQDNLPRRS